MIKFAGLRPRKTPDTAAAPVVVDVDEDLFAARRAKLGAANEALRNLLIDASTKINDVDTMRKVVARLVEPISRTLRLIETEQAEKAALQDALNTARAAHGKLRNDLSDLRKTSAMAEADRQSLRQRLETALARLTSAETSKADVAIDAADRCARIVELEARLVREAAENKTLANENRRLAARLQEVERDAGCAAAENPAREVEDQSATLSAERKAAAGALDQAKQRYERDMATQRVRIEALQARADTSEKLLAEVRKHLVTRAEAGKSKDQRLTELEREREALQARLSQIDAERTQQVSALKQLEEVHAGLTERADILARDLAAKEAALAQAEGTMRSLTTRIATLEQAQNAQQIASGTVDQLKTALSKERIKCSVLEGALDTARKDFSRVTRELMALQTKPPAAAKAA